MQVLFAVPILLSLLTLNAMAEQPVKKQHRVKPDEFIISFTEGTPYKETNPERFKEIADAGFNLVLGYTESLTLNQAIEQNKKILELCQQFGLKAILTDPRVYQADPNSPTFTKNLDAVIKDYSKHPAFYGYFVADEPGNAQIARVAAIHCYLIKKDPKHLPFINLFPVVASDCLGGPTFVNDPKEYPQIKAVYEKHLEAFVDAVQPKLLSYDEYDLFVGGGIRGMYFSNLELVRNAAKAHQIPFNNIVLVTPHTNIGTYRDPSMNDLRFLVYTTLAYGARGIMYFTYWTPQGWDGPGVIDRNGKKSHHYAQVSDLNRQIHNLAPLMAKLTCDSVYHVGKIPLECKPLPKGLDVVSAKGNDLLISFFSRKTDRYLMIVNKDLLTTESISIEFGKEVKMRELSAEDGRWTAWTKKTTFSGQFLAGQGRFIQYRFDPK